MLVKNAQSEQVKVKEVCPCCGQPSDDFAVDPILGRVCLQCAKPTGKKSDATNPQK
jgi:hypothetical protein